MKKSTWLLDFKSNVYSQSGEDGIIEKIFEILPENDKWCVEFGAWDGIYSSNTRNLIENKGYAAVLIEASKAKFNELQKNSYQWEQVITINQVVGFSESDNLDRLLSLTSISKDFDFLSIDIDGNDYHVWNAVSEYKPKLVCIEFNPTIPTEVSFVQPAEPSISQGCSLLDLVELGKTKGYELGSVLPWNAFFVRAEYYALFQIADNSPEVLRTNLKYVTYIFSGYDGRLFLRGYGKLPWHNIDLSESKIQHLPECLCKYPGNYGITEKIQFQSFSNPLASLVTQSPNLCFSEQLPMYSIAGYGKMIADTGRMDAYTQALQQAVKPDSVVLDIGTGTGIVALLACKFGARKVYAIEPSNVIVVAREIAAANGYDSRIEFIQDLSTSVTLPERADVIISDLRDILPWFKQHIPSIADARQRHLAPGGVLIPQSDTLWATLVSAPKLYGNYTTPWDSQPYGFNMEAAKRRVTNTYRKGIVTPEQFLTEAQSVATLDYYTIENPNVRAELTWTVAKSGTAHGLSIWFDATLAPGIQFSNAPGKPELIYGQTFFPLSAPVSLVPGDTVSVILQANLVGGDYIWRWATHVVSQSGEVKADFKQSTFFGTPISPSQLRKQT
jgi:protein arginine N-methyltransferase 1